MSSTNRLHPNWISYAKHSPVRSFNYNSTIHSPELYCAVSCKPKCSQKSGAKPCNHDFTGGEKSVEILSRLLRLFVVQLQLHELFPCFVGMFVLIFVESWYEPIDDHHVVPFVPASTAFVHSKSTTFSTGNMSNCVREKHKTGETPKVTNVVQVFSRMYPPRHKTNHMHLEKTSLGTVTFTRIHAGPVHRTRAKYRNEYSLGGSFSPY